MNSENRQYDLGFLDSACTKLLGHDTFNGMTELSLNLRDVRNKLTDDAWRHFSAIVLTHKIQQILQEDPFTHHAFTKPRGYPGDAQLLDYMYGHRGPPSDTSELGKAIFAYTTNTGFPLSVRSRRDTLSNEIDHAAHAFSSARIMSVACGHLREALTSNAVQGRLLGELIAFDQDQESLQHISEIFPHHNVRPVQGSIRNIISRGIDFSNLHLIYAAGLYDYLAGGIAAKLTIKLFDMLASDGRLLIANFAPSGRDIGYMEIFMGWKLVYRTEDDLVRLADGIPVSHIKARRVYRDQHKNIVYLELTRR